MPSVVIIMKTTHQSLCLSCRAAQMVRLRNMELTMEIKTSMMVVHMVMMI
jgi:hypothetical protein